MARKLGTSERALWAKVIASVTPLHRGRKLEAPAHEALDAPLPQELSELRPAPGRRPQPRAAPAPAAPGATLDGSWDRRLARGAVQPDRVVDLHGHSLAAAHALLDSRLDEAIASGARVLLLVTGKPPQGDRRPATRGAIRAAVGDWLAASRHAPHIAAIRAAHPRHGGAGALYIILRRSGPVRRPKS
ncbi:Smr/MutS family protein [Sphingomonas sp.]|uniref:Smr/MutS family protein n=1 Tax=Sphingomonas sp. TaxID=28214 RepID=UPI002FC8DF53